MAIRTVVLGPYNTGVPSKKDGRIHHIPAPVVNDFIQRIEGGKQAVPLAFVPEVNDPWNKLLHSVSVEDMFGMVTGAFASYNQNGELRIHLTVEESKLKKEELTQEQIQDRVTLLASAEPTTQEDADGKKTIQLEYLQILLPVIGSSWKQEPPFNPKEVAAKIEELKEKQ